MQINPFSYWSINTKINQVDAIFTSVQVIRILVSCVSLYYSMHWRLNTGSTIV